MATNKKLSDVKSKTDLPEGAFTNKAETIKKIILEHAGSKDKAIKMINYYINRAGDNLANKTEVLKAKRLIENCVDFSVLTDRLRKINFSINISEIDYNELETTTNNEIVYCK